MALGVLFRNTIADVLAVLLALGKWGVVLVARLLLLFVVSKWWQRLRFARQLRMDRITVPELQALIIGGKAPVILDVRSPESQAEEGVIPGATTVTRSDVDSLTATLPSGTEIVAYCNCPNEASAVQATPLTPPTQSNLSRPRYVAPPEREQSSPVPLTVSAGWRATARNQQGRPLPAASGSSSGVASAVQESASSTS